MILVTFTRRYISSSAPSYDYQRFETIEEFIDWYKEQGDAFNFTLPQRGRSLTQYGWLPMPASPVPVMETIDYRRRVATKIDRVICDEGILFEYIKHCSDSIVDCMALKCVKTTT